MVFLVVPVVAGLQATELQEAELPDRVKAAELVARLPMAAGAGAEQRKLGEAIQTEQVLAQATSEETGQRHQFLGHPKHTLAEGAAVQGVV
jgi:hypothetical protein